MGALAETTRAVNTMTNETPDTLKRLLQILAKQGTANDDITGNSRNHWRNNRSKRTDTRTVCSAQANVAKCQ